jgi:hypothetical protein
MKPDEPVVATFNTTDNNPLMGKLFTNVESNVITITEDKLKVILLEHLEKVEAGKRWITPTTLSVTLGTAIATTTFKDAGLAASTWEAAYWIALVGSAGWLAVSFVKLWRNREGRSIDALISKIKPPDVIPDK